jgi:hypothetical protein
METLAVIRRRQYSRANREQYVLSVEQTIVTPSSSSSLVIVSSGKTDPSQDMLVDSIERYGSSSMRNEIDSYPHNDKDPLEITQGLTIKGDVFVSMRIY